jgi:hypothetical protein
MFGKPGLRLQSSQHLSQEQHLQLRRDEAEEHVRKKVRGMERSAFVIDEKESSRAHGVG